MVSVYLPGQSERRVPTFLEPRSLNVSFIVNGLSSGVHSPLGRFKHAPSCNIPDNRQVGVQCVLSQYMLSERAPQLHLRLMTISTRTHQHESSVIQPWRWSARQPIKLCHIIISIDCAAHVMQLLLYVLICSLPLQGQTCVL